MVIVGSGSQGKSFKDKVDLLALDTILDKYSDTFDVIFETECGSVIERETIDGLV